MGCGTAPGRRAQDLTEHSTSRAIHYLPQVAVATAAVFVMPVAVVWWLHSAGIVTSPWLGLALAVALSLTASVLGNAYWKRRSGSGDIFFSELLLWGWLRRVHNERTLAKTVGLLGPDGLSGQLALDDEDVEQKAHVLRQMAAAVDAQDPYTDGHSRRVALHSAMVARKMGLEREEVAKLRTAAAVHDIGKLRIPPELLNKPGPLSESEFEIVKRHADDGAAIVARMGDPGITEMVRHHHERFDGGGYPSGLVAEQIPLGARIIAVADTFDALTSVRPYRSATRHKRALQAIADVSGTQLDPAVVRAFLRCYSANRFVIFWTLLAVSPPRALAWIGGGKAPARGGLTSATTVTMPAALAAVAVTAFAAVSGAAASHPPLRLAQQTSLQTAAGPNSAKHHSSGGRSGGPNAVTAVASPHKVAVLGVVSVRGAADRHSVKGGGTTAGSGAGGSGGGSTGGGAGGGSGGGSNGGGTGGGSGGGKQHGPSGGHGPTPTSPPTNGIGNTSSPVAGAPTDPTTTTGSTSTGATGAGGSGSNAGATSTSSSSGGSTGSGTAGGGSTGPSGPSGGGSGSGSQGGSGGGQGSGGSGSGSGGSGSGSGGSGSGGGNSGGSGGGSGGPGGSGGGNGGPPSKNSCKNGGWFQFGFLNQGLCIAFFLHELHP
jgi:HD-GYP domain-containing protein (c-di-GMP phosphodiesterase class II)